MYVKLRFQLLLVISILIPLGFYTKFYHGPAQSWVQNYGGDILYPMFWFFVLIFVRPNIFPAKAAIIVFVLSTTVEFTQLISHPLLNNIRLSFIGRTVIGTSFVPIDIFYYFTGCVLAFLIHGRLYNLRFPFSTQPPKGKKKPLKSGGD